MRFLFIILLLIGCQSNQHKPKPYDTKYKEEERNWEYLYAIELENALMNEDDLAFYFFWPYYLEARYENKQKKLEKNK